MPTDPQKKRHHYIPICYLNGFTDLQGRIFAYRKDNPHPPLHLVPDAIAFERYYYSQPLPDGGRDNSSIEDFFGKIETTWPAIVDRIYAREEPYREIDAIAVFLSTMRVRVPAARDMIEQSLADIVMAETRRLDESGRFPPKPEGLSLDDVRVAIDPHQSLHAMADLIQAFGAIINRLGFEVCHNNTDITFVSSDNPVVYYDPDAPPRDMLPYHVRRSRRIEFLFPITKDVILRGRSHLAGRRYIRHVSLTSEHEVRRINRLIARFGYRFVFAADKTHEPLIKKYSSHSPVLTTNILCRPQGGSFIRQDLIFGARTPKPKWTDRFR